MSAEQESQREIDLLTEELAIRDKEVDSLRSRLILDDTPSRAAIVRSPGSLGDEHESDAFHEALHALASVSRLRIGAHQCAISYIPDGNHDAAIHTYSFSEKYQKYNSYDVTSTGKGILGMIVEGRKAVRMTESELYSHPRFRHFSDLKNAQGLEHPPLPGWLAAPIFRRDGGLIGVVQLSDKINGDFTQADEDQLVTQALVYSPTFELQYLYENSQRLAEALRQTSLELQRSNAELEQFAYVASHDLQEPLRMVTSYLQLLERRYRDRLDQDASEFIGFAVDGASRMQTLIQDLLAYSRVGTRGADFTPTDCDSVLDRVLAGLGVAIAESGARIAREPLPTLAVDPSQMAQLLQNLVGNAIKFRGESPPRIRVAAESRPEDWLFSVQDNGIGIGPGSRGAHFPGVSATSRNWKVSGNGYRPGRVQEDSGAARGHNLGRIGGRGRIYFFLHHTEQSLATQG